MPLGKARTQGTSSHTAALGQVSFAVGPNFGLVAHAAGRVINHTSKAPQQPTAKANQERCNHQWYCLYKQGNQQCFPAVIGLGNEVACQVRPTKQQRKHRVHHEHRRKYLLPPIEPLAGTGQNIEHKGDRRNHHHNHNDCLAGRKHRKGHNHNRRNRHQREYQ